MPFRMPFLPIWKPHFPGLATMSAPQSQQGREGIFARVLIWRNTWSEVPKMAFTIPETGIGHLTRFSLAADPLSAP